MALRVINHYPDINDIDVPRNIYVKVEFNSGIIPSALDYTQVSVNDASTFTTVPGTIGVEFNSSGQSTIVVFQPTINLTANTKYSVYVFGKPNSVIGIDGTQLESTYKWDFTTGSDVIVGQIPKGIPSGEFSLSGILSGETAPLITSFEILSTDPQNQEPNVPTKLSGIYITFNTDIASSLLELSSSITIDETCIF
jgi:hypothetical protein